MSETDKPVCGDSADRPRLSMKLNWESWFGDEPRSRVIDLSDMPSIDVQKLQKQYEQDPRILDVKWIDNAAQLWVQVKTWCMMRTILRELRHDNTVFDPDAIAEGELFLFQKQAAQ